MTCEVVETAPGFKVRLRHLCPLNTRIGIKICPTGFYLYTVSVAIHTCLLPLNGARIDMVVIPYYYVSEVSRWIAGKVNAYQLLMSRETGLFGILFEFHRREMAIALSEGYHQSARAMPLRLY